MATLYFETAGFPAHDDNGNKYTCYVVAEAEYSYSPGRMYMSNGDPGYPDDEEIEITDLQVYNIRPKVNDKKIIEQIEEDVTDQLYEMDLKYWDSDEEDPFECDDGEEPWLDEDY
jgi:hypothetical protein